MPYYKRRLPYRHKKFSACSFSPCQFSLYYSIPYARSQLLSIWLSKQIFTIRFATCRIIRNPLASGSPPTAYYSTQLNQWAYLPRLNSILRETHSNSYRKFPQKYGFFIKFCRELPDAFCSYAKKCQSRLIASTGHFLISVFYVPICCICAAEAGLNSLKPSLSLQLQSSVLWYGHIFYRQIPVYAMVQMKYSSFAA